MAGSEREWVTVPLDELTEEGSPITYGVVKPGEVGDVPFVRGGDIAGGRVLMEQLRTISHDVSQQYRRTLLRGGEILVSLVGNPGQIAIAPSSLAGANIARQVGLVRLKSSIDTKFISYFLQSHEGQASLGAHSLGSVQQVINLRDLKTVKVPVPPLAEQRAIAHILGTLDDKIELNRRMNETLEGMARAIFKSWFVDFDPVRAKADGRQPAGMDAATAALFPDSFEDSPLGKIPKGWKVESLDSIGTFLNGLALQKFPPRGDGDLPVIKIAQLRQGGTVGADLANSDVPTSHVIHDGDVLFSWSGTLEVRVWAGGVGALNQHLFKVSSERFPKWLSLYWVLEHLPDFQAIAASKATTMGHIQRHHLTEALAVLPCERLIGAASRLLAPTMELQTQLAVQARNLAITRDALLPKLLSGEIRVTDVGTAAGIAAEGRNVPEPIVQQTPPQPRAGNDIISLPIARIAAAKRPLKPEETAAPRSRLALTDFETPEIMAAFRQAVRGRGLMEQNDVLKAVSERLGFERLGPATRGGLARHLRAAIRRGIVSRKGKFVGAETYAMEGYTRDELVQALVTVTRRDGRYDRKELMQSVAQHLGFRRVTESVSIPIKSAINAAIRRGLLVREGEMVRRTK